MPSYRASFTPRRMRSFPPFPSLLILNLSYKVRKAYSLGLAPGVPDHGLPAEGVGESSHPGRAEMC